jgi:hypothetical protein
VTRTGRAGARVGLAAVALLAFSAHAAYSLLASPNILPISDASGYRLLGEHLERGLGYIRPYDHLSGVTRPTAEFPPGFPTLLAGFRLLGLESVSEQRVGLAVLHAGVAVLVVLLARRWFRDSAALVVGALAALHPALIQPGAALLAESLFALLAVAMLLAAVRLREQPSPERVIVLGLLGGASTLVRSEGLVLAVLLALPAFVVVDGARDRLRTAAVLAAALLLLPGGWAVRNLQTFEEPVLLSNNLGSVLSGSNCEQTYEGDLVGYWLITPECFSGFTDERLRDADESEVAVELRDDGLGHAEDHLGDLPRVAAVRVLRTFQLWEPEQQARLGTFEGRKLLTERITGWIAWGTYVLAAIGAVACWRRRDRSSLWLLGSPVAVVALVSAATYGNPRFRIGADVPLLLLAALGVQALWSLSRDGRGAGRRSPTG